MTDTAFQALVVRERSPGSFTSTVESRAQADLPPGEVLVRVRYSSLNYKDALSATGHRGVTRRYPHTPGIDAAGTVAESNAPSFRAGDEVVVTGHDLGMNTPGGYGQYIRVPAAWVVPLPPGLTLRDAMIFGTAGFTAAQCIRRLRQHGVKPKDGDILVTGATGGVGCLAVLMLAHLGFRVVAATGKPERAQFLRGLGAAEVEARRMLRDTPDRGLLNERWAAVVDTVGGEFLSAALKSTKYRGAVTCCGLVASAEIHSFVYPFILRGVTLYGIDSAACPDEERKQIWMELAGPLRAAGLESVAREVPLDALVPEIEAILKGRITGRIVVRLP